MSRPKTADRPKVAPNTERPGIDLEVEGKLAKQLLAMHDMLIAVALADRVTVDRSLPPHRRADVAVSSRYAASRLRFRCHAVWRCGRSDAVRRLNTPRFAIAGPGLLVHNLAPGQDAPAMAQKTDGEQHRAEETVYI